MRTESASVYWDWFRERSSDLYDRLSNAIAELFLTIRGMGASFSRPEGVRFSPSTVVVLNEADSATETDSETLSIFSAVKMPSDAEQIKKDLKELNEEWKRSKAGLRAASFAKAFGKTRPPEEIEWFKEECLALLRQDRIERSLVQQIALSLPGDSMPFVLEITKIQ